MSLIFLYSQGDVYKFTFADFVSVCVCARSHAQCINDAYILYLLSDLNPSSAGSGADYWQADMRRVQSRETWCESGRAHTHTPFLFPHLHFSLWANRAAIFSPALFVQSRHLCSGYSLTSEMFLFDDSTFTVWNGVCVCVQADEQIQQLQEEVSRLKLQHRCVNQQVRAAPSSLPSFLLPLISLHLLEYSKALQVFREIQGPVTHKTENPPGHVRSNKTGML